MPTPTKPTTEWPKPYLLQIHAAAVENGLIFVGCLTAENADSLKQRLYRARRRSDKAMAAFIPPEYHMVMVGEYQPIPDPADPEHPGRLPIIYDVMPSGDLPPIRAATGEEIEAASRPQLAEPPPPISADAVLDLESLNVQMAPEEIGGFVDKMLKKVGKSSDS